MDRQYTRRNFLKLAAATIAAIPLAGLRFRASATSRHNAAPYKPRPDPPNIILLVFDTLTARHMSLYGHPRHTTPHLERFANQATVYHHHYAAGNFTSPGTASLLTGVYPWKHRAFQHGSLICHPFSDRSLFHLIGENYHRIGFAQTFWADLFLQQFHSSLDYHIDPTAFNLYSSTFFNKQFARQDPLLVFRSFEGLLFDEFSWPASFYGSMLDRLNITGHEWLLERYRDEYPKGLPNLTKYNGYFRVEDIFDGLSSQLESLPSPQLCYFHLYPPHEPYLPRREFIGIFQDRWNSPAKPEHYFSDGLDEQFQAWAQLTYDEYIAQVDAEFGRFYDHLQNLGILEDSFVIVTTDHGQLFERGVHGHDTPLLYESLIHAPLLIHRPGQIQREDVFTPTSTVDLLPTLLHATGRPIPDWCDGVPLLGKTIPEDRPIYAIEAKRNSSFGPLTTCTIALIRYPYKLIAYLGYQGYDSKYELYQLDKDPEELDDLSVSRVDTFKELKEELHHQLDLVNQPYRKP